MSANYSEVHNLKAVALIPARAGSKRVPDKNVRRLGAHPLLAYSIAAALSSKAFESVVVSTDSPHYAEIAQHYGAQVIHRPVELAGDLSPDIEWVEHALQELKNGGREFDCFSILRPTSPFRQAATIQRAWQQFQAAKGVDSLRAVEKCSQHPGKMWIVRGEADCLRMTPLLPLGPATQPWHSSQYQSLPEIWVQNASLEIAWTHVVRHGRTIAGNIVMPFITQGEEGFDVNHPRDWRDAEELLQNAEARLPEVAQAPF